MRFVYLSALLLAVATPTEAQSPFVIQSAGDSSEEGLAMLWSDVDGDAHTDLLMVNASGQHTLFRNDGSGGLDPEPFSLPTGSVADGVFVDLDGDGDRDLLLGSLSASHYYENRQGRFVQTGLVGLTGASNVRNVEPVDVNRDGRLDLFVSRRRSEGNYLLTQTDTGAFAFSFVEPTVGTGSTNMTCWSDVDLDGDLDAFVVNGGGSPNIAYRNDGGFLTAYVTGAEQSASVAGTSCAWGDEDADGDFDLFVTAVGSPSQLYLNDGQGSLSLAAPGAAPDLDGDVISARWDDIDLDGDLDLLAVGRFEPLRLYLNESGSFTEFEIPGLNATPSYRTAAATFDVDGDGDLELAVGAGFNNSFEPSILYRNDLAGAPNWIGVRLRSETTLNTDGVGGRVTVFSTVDGEARVQLREIRAHSSRLAQSDMTVMVGLGSGGRADSVRVDWPNGAVSVVYPDAPNQVLTLDDSTPVGREALPRPGFALTIRPNPSEGYAVGVLDVDVPGDIAVSLVDVLGRQVWALTLRASPGRTEVPLPRLAAGTYVLRARGDRRTVARRLTVAR